jgi:hypothetical protein
MPFFLLYALVATMPMNNGMPTTTIKKTMTLVVTADAEYRVTVTVFDVVLAVSDPSEQEKE